MKHIIQKTIFEKKLSLFTPRLALSTPSVDHTYGELADMIADIAGYIKYQAGIEAGQKVLVCQGSRKEALLILLALLKLQADITLIDDQIADTSFRNILSKETPDLIITERDMSGIGISCKVLQIGSDFSRDYTTHDVVARAEDVRLAMKVKIYVDGEEPVTYIDKAVSGGMFDRICETVGAVAGDRYLVLGQTGFDAFIPEALWCLWNGVHLLYYPDTGTMINELLPDADRFSMDFTLFFFGSTKENPEEDCYELLMESVKHADQYNYRAIWTPERHFNEFGGKYPNPSVLSAAIAAVTSKIQIRTGSIVAPLHHVVRIAEDWSVIDNLSGGRTAISFASGWQCNDFIFYPERYARRHEATLDQINDFRKLWSGEKLAFNNGEGDKVQIGIYPKPIQKEMAIWVTVSGKIETFIDAGRIGANILTHLLWQDPADLVEKIQAYRQSLEDNGYDPASRTVSVMLHTYVGKTQEEVRKLVEKPLKEYIRSSLNLIEAMTDTAKATRGNNSIGRYSKNDEQMTEDMKEELLEFAFQRFLANTSLLGDQEHCSQVLKRLRSYGVDELACLIDFGLDNTSILGGLHELNKLKDRYSAASQKKYTGSIILRISDNTLSQFINAGRRDIEKCRKIISDRNFKPEKAMQMA